MHEWYGPLRHLPGPEEQEQQCTLPREQVVAEVQQGCLAALDQVSLSDVDRLREAETVPTGTTQLMECRQPISFG